MDLKKDHACTHCRSPLSLLDPQAVEKALQGYARAVKATAPSAPAAVGVADALIMLERDRQRALREPGAQRSALLTSDASSNIDLWSIGIALVAAVLN